MDLLPFVADHSSDILVIRTETLRGRGVEIDEAPAAFRLVAVVGSLVPRPHRR
jgi:hypothetical protein